MRSRHAHSSHEEAPPPDGAPTWRWIKMRSFPPSTPHHLHPLPYPFVLVGVGCLALAVADPLVSSPPLMAPQQQPVCQAFLVSCWYFFLNIQR
jgi:hypothetical protein